MKYKCFHDNVFFVFAFVRMPQRRISMLPIRTRKNHSGQPVVNMQINCIRVFLNQKSGRKELTDFLAAAATAGCVESKISLQAGFVFKIVFLKVR